MNTSLVFPVVHPLVRAGVTALALLALACCTAPTPPIQPKVLYTARPSISHADPPGSQRAIVKAEPPKELTPAEKAALPLYIATGVVGIALLPPAILVIALGHARP